jgi:peptidoglycan/LPS O-acetylase OafA/YrhL
MYYSISDFLPIFASGAIIVFALHSRAQRWLDTPVPEYLGRISYSMYLTHGVVLFSMLILLAGRLPIWILAVIFLATVLVVAHLFCILVEEPALRFGRRITAGQTD